MHVLKRGPRLQKPLREEQKQEWAIEKPKLDNARSLRGIYSIHPDDEEYKDIQKCEEKIGKT